MSYFRFFISHKRILSLGMLLTFSSSFGQTFLVSLFVPQFLGEFRLSHGEFGFLYSGATLLAAAFLPFFGSLLDRTHLRIYAPAVAAGLALSALTVGLSGGVLSLFVGLFGLRLTGQGLMTHTALTSMARDFTAFRGKALAVANTGFPVGEAVLPIVIASLLPWAGWRASWTVVFGFVVLALIPTMLWLLEPRTRGSGSTASETSNPAPPGVRSRSALLGDPRFYALVPAALILPFVMTGLFLYQLELADLKGWSEMIMASAFVGFAAGRVTLSLVAGPSVDRWGASRLYPVYLLPLGLAVLGVAGLSAPWVPVGCFFLAGATQGMGGVVKSALWAEVYGTESLGTVRSLITSLMVFATASSPAVFGWLLDQGFSVSGVLLGTLFPILASMASAWWICGDLRKGRGGASVLQSAESGG
jgi:MFS family permease